MANIVPSRFVFWIRAFSRMAIIVILSLGALALRDCSVVRSIDQIAYDLRVTHVAAGQVPGTNLVVIAVDDQSLRRAEDVWGRWPWPRDAFTSLLSQCGDASVFGMTMLLPEIADQVSGEETLSTRSHSNFVAAAALTEHPMAEGPDKEMALRFSLFVHDIQNLDLHERSFLIPPRPPFTSKVDALGFVNMFPDPGGTVRSYPLFIEHNGLPYPSFAVGVISRAFGDTNRQAYVESPAPQERWLRDDHTVHLRGMQTHVSDDGGFQIVFQKTSPFTIPALEVLTSFQEESAGRAAKYPMAFFKNKIVLLGSTTTGMQNDRRSTPSGARVPSVLIHATAIDNLLSGHQFRNPPPVVLWTLCLVLAAFPWTMNRARPQWVFLFSGVTLLLYLGFLALAAHLFWMFPAMPPFLAWLFSFLIYAGIRWDSEQKKAKELERLEDAKQQFTDMLVHDLKGQIGNLGLSVEMMEELSDDESLAPLIQSMNTSGQRLLSQVNSLLDIRRMEEGRMPIRKETLALHGLVDRCVQEFEPSAKLVGLTVHYTRNPELTSPVQVDPAVMQRVLANLILNAIQYGKPGTQLEVHLSAEDCWAVLEIENEGRNLPEGEQHSLFQPFHYFEQPTESNLRAVSTGLGLSFCKLAVEAHEGIIGITSPLADGRMGVCVRVRLPLSDDAGL